VVLEIIILEESVKAPNPLTNPYVSGVASWVGAPIIRLGHLSVTTLELHSYWYVNLRANGVSSHDAELMSKIGSEDR